METVGTSSGGGKDAATLWVAVAEDAAACVAGDRPRLSVEFLRNAILPLYDDAGTDRVESWLLARQVASHPNVPPEWAAWAVGNAARAGDGILLGSFAANPAVPGEVLRAIWEQGKATGDVDPELAGNPSTPADVLEALAAICLSSTVSDSAAWVPFLIRNPALPTPTGRLLIAYATGYFEYQSPRDRSYLLGTLQAASTDVRFADLFDEGQRSALVLAAVDA